nr:reverse transcriptase domain-containing protein [Tanacetum cinerariifolium]
CDFKDRLETILDFKGLTPEMRHDLDERVRMVYTGDDGHEIFLGSEKVIPDKEDLSDYWIEISSYMDFLRASPSYTYIRDSLRRLCHRHTKGSKSGARLSRGHFIRRLALHFGLVSDDGLGILSVVTRELLVIDMGELVKLNICMENSSYLGLRKKYHLSLKNDMLPRDKPLNRDSSFKDSVLSKTEKSSKKVEVYDKANKKTDLASTNVVLNKNIVTDVDVKTLLKQRIYCVFRMLKMCLSRVMINVLRIITSMCIRKLEEPSLLRLEQQNLRLGHNLFSIVKFYDGDLEVAFRFKTCRVRNLKGDDLLTGARESNFYTISIFDMTASLPVCRLSKAISIKSWLWHCRLLHLNFDTINDLTNHDLVDGVSKFKYCKDHLCSACERGMSKKSSHQPKLVPSTNSKLELLHMDLCGSMRVATINRKKRSKQIVKPELCTIVKTPVATMEDTRTMLGLLQAPTEGYRDAIVIPAILAIDFKLKVGLLQLVTSSQFHGFERDDPHAHIRWFNKITSMLKYKNVPSDAIKLMLFPFFLEGAARTWLEKEPPRSIHTWEDIVSKFMNYFFPPSKTTNLKNDITKFQQNFDETFSKAWDRFKDLLRKCPHHGISELHQIDTFYNLLTQSDQNSLNAAAGGNLLNRTPRDALTIIENKSKVRTSRNKLIVSKVNTTTSSSSPSSDITALTDIVKELVLMNKDNQQAFMKAIEETCVTCGEPHPYYECLSIDSNIFNASAATRTYNQGANPRGELKPITTRSGVACDGPMIPPTSSSLPKEVERETEATKDKVQATRRPFLRTAHALVDVHGEELILRDGDEKLFFHADNTLKYPHKHGNDTTPLSNSSPSFTRFETSDSLLEEFTDELALLDLIPPGKEDNNFEFEADLREIEFLLHQDPSTESKIETINPILEKFTDEPSHDYLPSPGDDDDDDDNLFDLKSDNDE